MKNLLWIIPLLMIGCRAHVPVEDRKPVVMKERPYQFSAPVAVKHSVNILAEDKDAIVRVDGDRGRSKVFALLSEGSHAGSVDIDAQDNMNIKTLGHGRDIVIRPTGAEAARYGKVAESEYRRIFGTILPKQKLVGVVTPVKMNIGVLYSEKNGWVLPTGTDHEWQWIRLDGKELVSDAEERHE